MYIGNTPAENYASFLTETFSVSATASYTLSHAVTNENDIRLVINGVVQQPGSGKAYTASGTTLTLTSATVSGDVMYAVYLGRALQTVNPPNASVGSAQIADSLISGKTALGATPADTDELLISDAGTLKRVDFSHLKQANTPAFQATTSGSTTMANQTATKIAFASEVFDTDSAYDTSNSRFTPQTAGKYAITANIRFNSGTDFNDNILRIYKNGSSIFQHQQSNFHYESNTITSIVTLNGSSDYIEIFGFHNEGNNVDNESDTKHSLFQAYRIIGA